MRRLSWVVLLALLVGGCSGCSAFRAQLGLGFGIGAVAHVPAIGKFSPFFGGGSFYHLGHEYGREGWTTGNEGGADFDAMVNAFCGLVHAEYKSSAALPDRRYGRPSDSYVCFIAPPLTGSPKDTYHPWSLEVDIYLLFLSVRVGFNPWFLDNPNTSESGFETMARMRDDEEGNQRP